MRHDPEKYLYLLDCWKTEDPDPEEADPEDRVSCNNRRELEEQAQRLWNARERNGYRCLILYHYEGDGWQTIRRWEDD
jgi:hypothetical protein